MYIKRFFSLLIGTRLARSLMNLDRLFKSLSKITISDYRSLKQDSYFVKHLQIAFSQIVDSLSLGSIPTLKHWRGTLGNPIRQGNA